MKILVIRIKGLGNMVLFTPTLVNLRKNFPGAKIVLLADNLCQEVVRGSSLADEIVHFDLGWPLLKRVNVALNLRKERFDFSVMMFPANKLQYNILAFVIGAKKRITHDFRFSRFRTMAFLQNLRVPAMKGIHDVEQNLNLLGAFGVKASKESLYFHVSDSDKEFAEEFFGKNNLKQVIGIHPGGTADASQKRWPIGHFIEVSSLFQDKGYDILLVAGPGEEKLVEEIRSNFKKGVMSLKEVSIKKVAAVISRCKGFLSTDSGIGHTAAAMKVPTLAIIGPADAKRISPYGDKCGFISNKVPCSPCRKYPFSSDKSGYDHIKCKDFPCLSNITPKEVYDKLMLLIKEGSR